MASVGTRRGSIQAKTSRITNSSSKIPGIHVPVVLRVRTANRTDQTQVPSLTPVYRGAELQEREVYDLFGVIFEGHPDLRRILMWDGYQDYPMRKDYVEPDDYQYEPTPHDQVLKRARRHYPAEEKEAQA